tara:strand:- start:3298 stop:4092 length:795 start_codon:yes stop_codon:yes gene_type:complete
MQSKKIALGIEYLGTNYHGWQKQTSATLTIQAVIEKVLSKVADEEIKTNCAGRTDKGVHAFAQVIDFEISSFREDGAWIKGANSLLPNDIKIVWVQTVKDSFHSRFSAISRTYSYLIRNTKIPSALWANRSLLYQAELDCVSMQKAANLLIGEKDFSSFRSSGCQSNSPVREIYSIDVKKNGNFISVTIKANAFLQNMVRIIVGTLLEIGSGSLNYKEMGDILNSKDRESAGKTASPDGLYFIGPLYDLKYQIPFILPDTFSVD